MADDTPNPEPVDPDTTRRLSDYEPVPVAPWDITLNNSTTDFLPLPDGGMILVFVPLIVQPGQPPKRALPAIRVRFSAAGWKRHQEDVARDGVKSKIAVASDMPPSSASPPTIH